MSSDRIDKLTPEQEALIPVYREKSRQLIFSTERIEPQKAAEAIEAAYIAIKRNKPEIVFFDSPEALLNEVLPQLGGQLWSPQLGRQLKSKFSRKLIKQIGVEDSLSKFFPNYFTHLWSPLTRYPTFPSELVTLIRIQIAKPGTMASTFCCSKKYFNCIYPGVLIVEASLIDFCIDVLNYPYHQESWKALQMLIQNCGWIFPYEKFCFVCDRPTNLSFDSQQHFHGIGNPAIEFADGFSVYAYHGVRLPEKYGKLSPSQWQTTWLLEEKNAELRRILIQEIGYERICQELEAEEQDSWQEYTLLRINNNIDIEPICLLKMSCPSTGKIHALRVPPNINSAREAIRWVNWETDPEEFSVQT